MKAEVRSLLQPVIRAPKEHITKPKSLIDLAGEYGREKAKKNISQSIGLAIFAGAFIALAFIFYITVTTGASSYSSWGATRLIGGVAFSLGLILVVVAGGELFTSTVLTSVAWLQRKISTKQMLLCWLRVYVGNFIGAMLILVLALGGQLYSLDNAAWGLNAMHIAQHKLHHTWYQAFSLGILCNLLVCLAIWMTFTTKDVLTKAVLLILPVAMFVASGFEHSIANMFMVPLGICIKLLNVTNSIHGEFYDLTLYNFVYKNLIPVTLGNIAGGGILVGIGYWATYKEQSSDTQITPPPQKVNNFLSVSSSIHQSNFQEGFIMNNAMKKTKVRELMIANTVVLSADMSLIITLRIMAENHLRVLPVVDTKQRLQGIVSEHDVLRHLWSEEFSPRTSLKIRDIMQTEVLTVEPDNLIADLIEFMTVDRNKLFPVNDSGFATAHVFQNYEERLRAAGAQRPSVYPVVVNGTLCGVVRRIDIVEFLAKTVTDEKAKPTQINRAHPIETGNIK